MVTPFRADGSVNDEAGVALARHLLEQGSHGLVVCGTTGEASTMTDEEHVGFVRTIASELGDEAPDLRRRRLQRHPARRRTSPRPWWRRAPRPSCPSRRTTTSPTAAACSRHFGEVARAASGRPVILYNIPSRTALNMPPDLLAELAQIDGIEAVKQSNGAELGPIDGLERAHGQRRGLPACARARAATG